MRTILRKSISAVAAFAFLSLSAHALQQGATPQSPKPAPIANCPMAQSNHSERDVAQNANHSATANCPMMRVATLQHSQNDMNARGEKGMGFSQTATQHHFFLTANGGAVQIVVKDASDEVNRDAIRMHLKHISQAFASGDFDIPMFVHSTTPPGVIAMKQLRGEIRYSFEQSPDGGRVVIVSSNQAAVDAIHQFLRFQIREHATGNSMDIRSVLPQEEFREVRKLTSASAALPARPVDARKARRCVWIPDARP